MWNEEKRLQGWKDSPLTKQGITDAKKLGDFIKNYHIDQVFSSPIGRAYQTASYIFPYRHIIKDNRLKEMNFGDYEGMKISELKDNKHYYNLWHCPSPNRSLPNGETFQSVVDRLNDFFQERYQEDPQQTIFLTIHGMLFTILHGIILNLPIERFNEVNKEIVRGCSLSLIIYDGKQFTIQYIGKDNYLTPMKTKIIYK